MTRALSLHVFAGLGSEADGAVAVPELLGALLLVRGWMAALAVHLCRCVEEA